jgi:predicted outer membrane protein
LGAEPTRAAAAVLVALLAPDAVAVKRTPNEQAVAVATRAAGQLE